MMFVYYIRNWSISHRQISQIISRQIDHLISVHEWHIPAIPRHICAIDAKYLLTLYLDI